jgi:anti-sigma B factor antagonist
MAGSGNTLADVSVRSGDDGSVVVEVSGEIDIGTASAVREATDEALRGRPRRLVVDLSGVSFLGSAGVAVLAAADHRQRGQGGDLRVVAATRATRRVLELTGLDEQLSVHATLADALAG